MALENATLIHQLDPANPAGPDRLANGDDHIRMIKRTLQATFPGITAPMTLTQAFLNTLSLSIVPVGAIQAWYGAANAVPAGFALCDGRTVARSDGSGNITTPDLRGRVPVGATEARPTGTLFGQEDKTFTTETGGAHNHIGTTKAGDGKHAHQVVVEGHALTINELPAHSHEITVQDNSSTGSSIEDANGSGAAQKTQTSSVGGGAAHTHNATITPDTGAHQHELVVDAVPAHSHALSVNVNQASISLHYIMKV